MIALLRDFFIVDFLSIHAYNSELNKIDLSNLMKNKFFDKNPCLDICQYILILFIVYMIIFIIF